MSDDDVKVYKASLGLFCPRSSTGQILRTLQYNYSNISQSKMLSIIDSAPCVFDLGDGTLWQIIDRPNGILEFCELEVER